MRPALLALATLSTLAFAGGAGCTAADDEGDEVGATEGAATTLECAKNSEGIPSCLAAQLPPTAQRLDFKAVVRATGPGSWSVRYDLVVPAYTDASGRFVPERRTPVTDSCGGTFSSAFSSRVACSTTPATGTAYYARTSASFPNSFRYMNGDDIREVAPGQPSKQFTITASSGNLTKQVSLPQAGSFTLSGVVNAYAASGAWVGSMDCPSATFSKATAARSEAPYTCRAQSPGAVRYVFALVSSGASFPETR